MLADVQCCGDRWFQLGIQRIHDGALGDLKFGECHYEADLIPWQGDADNTPEGRLPLRQSVRRQHRCVH
jgi:hypothetical protein